MNDEVCIKITGLNLTRLVDKLILKGVLIKDLVYKSNYIKFIILNKDIKTLNKICKLENKYYEILYKNGFKRLFFKLPYLLGSVLALLISLSFILSFSLFIYSVDVSYSSSSSYDISKVEAYLTESGIKCGMKKNEVDTTKLQNDIILNFDDIAGCSVLVDGGALKVIVYPASMKDKLKQKQIISKYDGIVTHATSFSGELKVKEGDIVRAGQVLIESDVEALGEVAGKVYFTSSIIYNERQQFLERTGKTFTYDNLLFFKKFRINGNNNSNFANYETKICSFYFNANLFIPIEIERITLYEVEVKERLIPFSNVEADITKRAYDEALKKVPNDVEILNTTYSVVSEGPYTRVDCFIETEISLF